MIEDRALPKNLPRIKLRDRLGLNTAEAEARMAYYEEQFEIAQQIYDLRIAAGLTQVQLAARVGTTASVISRLEDADYRGHSMGMLRRIAQALGKRVEVRFVDRELSASGATLSAAPAPSP